MQLSSDGINMISLQAEIHSTYGNSGDYYSVNMMDTTNDPPTPSKLQVQYDTFTASFG